MAITPLQPVKRHLTVALCGLSALSAGLLVGFWWLLAPARTELADARDQTQVLTEALEAQRDRLADGPNLHETQRRLQARLADRDGFLPSEPNAAAILAELASDARQAGLIIERFTPRVAAKHPGNAHIPINATVNGPWTGIAAFLVQLTHHPRFITINQFDLEPMNPTNLDDGLRFSAELSAHWRPGRPTVPPSTHAPRPDRPRATHFDALAQNPFATERNRREPSPALWPHYLGRITQGAQIWALIRDRDGEIHRVQAGDPLTTTTQDGEHLRVEAIEATSLTLTAIRPGGEEPKTHPINLPLRKRQSSGACPWPCPDL